MSDADKHGLRLPGFICIGAQRAGTTWLHHCLKEHPEIYMPDKKELRFFNYNYEDGIDSYSSKFGDAGDSQVIGEITPDYYRQEYALHRIKKHIPDVKLIFILRNPIDRAYSHYQLYRGTEYQVMTFRETYLKHNDLIEWGKYGKWLEILYRNFDSDNVLVLDYELLDDSPGGFLRQVYRFIGVSESFSPVSITKKYNKVMYPTIQSLLNKIGMGALVEVVKRSALGDWLRRRQRNTGDEISRQDFEYLSKEFSSDVKKLGEITNKDYTYWLKR